MKTLIPLICFCVLLTGCQDCAKSGYNLTSPHIERNPTDREPIPFTNPYELTEQELETEIAKIYTRSAEMDKIHPALLGTHHDLEANLMVLKLFILLDAKGAQFNTYAPLISE